MHSSEQVEHLHRCACGQEWLCGRADCTNRDECYQCEIDHHSQWLEDHGFEPQRSLALTAEERETF